MSIPSEKLRTYQEKFLKSHSIEDFLAYFSVYVWEQMEFNAKNSDLISRVSETELTQNLIRQLAMLIFRDEIQLPIRMFHAKNENVNGADLEIVLSLSKDHNILFPCQAKRLYVNDRKDVSKAVYKSIWYEPKNHLPQIVSLINYSIKKMGYPLFILYNYTNQEGIDPNYSDDALFGCSLISASYVGEKHFFDDYTEKLHFKDLHQPGKPLSSLLLANNPDIVNTLWGQSNKIPFWKIQSDSEIDISGWNELNPPVGIPKRYISGINLSDILMRNSQKVSTLEFKPSFRIVITPEPIYHRKRNFVL